MVKEDKIDEEDEEEEKDEKEEKKVEEIHVGEEEGGGEGEEEEAVPEEEEGERRIEEGAGDAELQPADIPVTHYPKRQKKLPNAFNFCERAALTYNNPYRVSKKFLFLLNINIFQINQFSFIFCLKRILAPKQLLYLEPYFLELLAVG